MADELLHLIHIVLEPVAWTKARIATVLAASPLSDTYRTP